MFPAHAHFILIDDSRLDCFISEKIIKNANPDYSVRSFAEAEEALEFVKNAPLAKQIIPTVILLDIQMPVMNGFEFVEAFEKLPAELKSAYAIFMVSSSTNETDRIRIGNYPSIRHLYKKPLSKKVIVELVDQLVNRL